MLAASLLKASTCRRVELLALVCLYLPKTRRKEMCSGIVYIVLNMLDLEYFMPSLMLIMVLNLKNTLY